MLDRRSSERYPYQLNVLFQARGRGRGRLLGMGVTGNISSSGVLFSPNQPLEPGMEIEMAVEWPATFDGTRRLKLVGHGVVVRKTANAVAVEFEECRFCSRTEPGGELWGRC